MPSLAHGDVRLHFEEAGSGPPVLLAHSFLCSSEMWAAQVGPLSERARVLNVDLRGHGRSSPEAKSFDLYDLVGDLIAILDHLEIHRATWIGLSVGGMIALRAAVDHPDRVSALALLDTDAGAETAPNRLRYRAMAWGVRSFGIRPFLSRIESLMFGQTTRRTRRDLVAGWRERFSEVHLPSMLRYVDLLIDRDSVIDRLHEIRVPTLVVVGAEDESLPPDRSKRIAAGIPDARLAVVPGAGHLSAVERPEEVTRALLTLLTLGQDRGLRAHLARRSPSRPGCDPRLDPRWIR